MGWARPRSTDLEEDSEDSAVIYEANRIAAAKVKREARKSQLRPVSNTDAQPLSTCPRCQRTFRARIGLIRHLRINCTSRAAPTVVPPLASSSSTPPPTESDHSSEPPLPPADKEVKSGATRITQRLPCDAWKDLVRDRLDWRRTVKTGTEICKANRVTDVKANREAGKSQFLPSRNADAQSFLSCPRCQRTFRAPVGFIGHLQTNCGTLTIPADISPSASASPPPGR
nr:unnamed protein product [Spirometra erinaceieuropaei]